MGVRDQIQIVMVCLLILAGCVGYVSSASPTMDVGVDSSDAIGVNRLQVGFQASLQAGNLVSRSDIVDIYSGMKPKLVRIFDWRPEVEELDPCVYWYESSTSGSFNWRNVDRVVDTIFEMGAEPLICLGTSGSSYPPSSYDQRYLPKGMTLKSNLLPDYEQFAAYCRAWVRHFEETGRPIRYYEVWNEAWGYFDWGGEDSYRFSSWMNLWTACEREMHAESPGILIGNDHTTMKNVLETFIERDANLGFISYHKYDVGNTYTSDSTVFNRAESDFLEETPTCYGAEGAQQRWYQATRRLIPVINSESNMNYQWQPSVDPRLHQMSGAVWNALCLRKEILEGVNYHIYFDEYSYRYRDGSINGFGMVSWNSEPRKWYPYYLYQWMGNNLAVDDTIIRTTSSSSNTRALGWINSQTINILIIHKTRETETMQLTGATGQFRYCKIDETIPYTSPNVQEGMLTADEDITLNGYTVMLLQQMMPTEERLFDDGFETGNFSAWSGITITDMNQATVTREDVYYEEYCGRFGIQTSQYQTERAYVYKTIDEKTEVYARAYFRIQEGLPLDDTDDRFTLIQFLGPNESIICNLQVRRSEGEDRFAVLAFTGELQTTTTVLPRTGVWYCLEMYAKVHPTDGAVRAYINGDEFLSLTNLDTAASGNIANIRFGLANSIDVQHKVIVHCDSCAISTVYIGILRPWDINRDGKVNISDVAATSLALGSILGQPGWDPRVDVNFDGKIDIRDLVIVTVHFGESY